MKFLLLLATRNVRVQVKIVANAMLSLAPYSIWAVGICSVLELHNYILLNWLIPLIFLQFLSIVFLKSNLKYLSPALIILTKALQSVQKIIHLFCQARLHMVALRCFEKNCIKDMVTPLENIDSDRIVGIRYDFNDNSPLFILNVYLPAASHPIEESNEYLDYLWALYSSLSKTGFVIVMGDFNGNMGNSLGERGHYAPNDRGVKLLDFANYFNLYPTNLLSTCRGPLKTFVSHCGWFKSTIDYIFLPYCLFDSIVSSKVFEQTIDNTSDHLPVKLEINYSVNSCAALSVDNSSNTEVRDKIRWSKFTMENNLTSYASLISEELKNMNLADYNSLANSAEQVKNFMLKHSAPLWHLFIITRAVKRYILGFLMM